MSLETKVENIADDVNEIKITMVRQEDTLSRLTDSVVEHVARSNALQELIERTRNELEADIQPIKNHVTFVKGAMWALGIVGAIVLALNELGILEKLF